MPAGGLPRIVPATDKLPFTADDKLYWEVRKLQAETKDLTKHPVRRLGLWLSMIPAAVAVTGIAIQYYASSLDYRRASIAREHADFSVAQSQLELRRLDEAVEVRKRKVEELAKSAEAMETLRVETYKDLAAVEKLVVDLKDDGLDGRTRKARLAALEIVLTKLARQRNASDIAASGQTAIIGELIPDNPR